MSFWSGEKDPWRVVLKETRSLGSDNEFWANDRFVVFRSGVEKGSGVIDPRARSGKRQPNAAC